jgi:hydrogenase maturation protein HypF
MLRRARGYAPDPIPCARPPRPARPVLALGGDLKVAPAVGEDGRVWMAPHLGDAADPRCLERLRGAAATPAGWRLVRDAHPGYISHGLVDRLRPSGDGVVTVPHHLAHALAAMAEHDLRPPLLALTCDGLGYGPPGPGPGGSPLWGGELLLVEAGGWRRLGHLRPLPLPGGERAHREPPRVALGLLHAAGLPPEAAVLTARYGPADLALLRRALATGLQAPHTSSLGRLFDGVASLLDLCHRNSHEGEAALALQAAAERWAGRPAAAGPGTPPPLAAMAVGPAGADGALQLDWRPLLRGLLAARADGAHRDGLAWRFHQALADGLARLVERGAPSCPATTVVLAGGCFQNRLLTDLCREALALRGLRACWSEVVPCGDGGLALGQLWAVWAAVAMTPAEPSPGPGPRHVSGHLRPHPLDRIPPTGGMPRS